MASQSHLERQIKPTRRRSLHSPMFKIGWRTQFLQRWILKKKFKRFQDAMELMRISLFLSTSMESQLLMRCTWLTDSAQLPLLNSQLKINRGVYMGKNWHALYRFFCKESRRCDDTLWFKSTHARSGFFWKDSDFRSSWLNRSRYLFHDLCSRKLTSVST